MLYECHIDDFANTNICISGAYKLNTSYFGMRAMCVSSCLSNAFTIVCAL